MKKILNSILAFAIIAPSILGIFTVQNVSAQQDLADPNDALYVYTPVANSAVKNVISIAIRAFDDDQVQIPFSARLFDPGTCSTTNYGAISPLNFIASNSTDNTVINWNTRSTQKITNLGDGEYCLQICLTLQDGSTPYAACNSRNIVIINTNSLPSITSSPSNLRILSGNKFSYDVQASDPDGDQLKYRLITSTSEFTIDPNSGLISSTTLTTTESQIIRYPITVGVSDSKSGEVTQSFTVEVYKPAPQNPTPTPNPNPTPTPQPDPTPNPTPNPDPTPTPEPDPDPSPEPQPDNQDKVTKFSSPGINQVISEEIFTIKWDLAESNVKSLSLEYSNDETNWIKIGEDFEPTRNYYIWDLSDIADGDYFLRLQIQKENGQVITHTSPQFKIRIAETDDNEIQNIPLIINNKPENNAERNNDTQIAISADFLPSIDQRILAESAEILVNGKDFKENCVIDEKGILCTPKEQLPVGRTVVYISVQDSSEQKAELEWFFSVNQVIQEENDQESNSSETISILGREIPRSAVALILVVLCIGTILLVVPWILYGMWARRQEKKNITVTETNNYELDPNQLPNINVYADPNYGTNTYIDPYAYPAEQPTVQQDFQPDQPMNYDVTNNYYVPTVDPNLYTDPNVSPDQQPTNNNQDSQNFVEPDKQ